MGYYNQENPYASPLGIAALPAAMAEESARTAFIRRTYLHVFGAILLFVGIDAAIFTLVPAQTLQNSMAMIFSGKYGMLAVGLGFMAVAWVAQTIANSSTSAAVQYAGLLMYVVAEALFFVPLLFVADRYAPGAIPAAGMLTLLMFGGLTAFVLFTKADFTSWGPYLWWAGIASSGVVLAAIIFNFALGVWFSAAMVGFASVYILYDTSNILRRYRTDQHVIAALQLFASVAMLFYYLLRLLMQLNRRD